MFGKDWDKVVAGCVKDGVATLACVPAVFQNLVTAALGLAGVIAVFFIIWAGIKMVTSGGDPKQVEGARNTLTYAIIGLTLVLLSFFIINAIAYLTGAQCITQFGFDTC